MQSFDAEQAAEACARDRAALLERLRAQIDEVEAGTSCQSSDVHTDVGASMTVRCAAVRNRKHAKESGRHTGRFGKGDVDSTSGCPSDMPEGKESDAKQTVEGAWRKIQRLCAVREQSSVLLTQRLTREGFDAACVDEAVGRALACGLLDDARYAECLVRTRLAAGRGVAGIERELAKCGLSLENVDGWPECFVQAPDGENELSRAIALLRRNPPRSKNRREGAFRKLCSKGYSAGVASTAARMWSESADDDDL